jgi:CRP-like cAMP-binding protein
MPEVVEVLDDNRKIMLFKPGEVVIEEGTMPDGLYVLMTGSVEISVKGSKITDINAKGAFLGEIASLLRCRRIATVSASQDSKFLFIENITRYFEEHASSALAIAQTLASRIMDMNIKVVQYQKELDKLVTAGQDALRTQDLTLLKSAIEEMQRIIVDQREVEKKT